MGIHINTIKNLACNAALCAICCILFYSGWHGGQYMSLWDSANYVAMGEEFARTGSFPNIYGYDYNTFATSGVLACDILSEYPNYFFIFLIALIAWLFQPQTVLAYISISCAFSAIALVAVYKICFYFLQDKLASRAFTLLFFALPAVLRDVAAVLTDNPLLCFLAIALLCVLHGRYCLAGAMLGIGFCFREQGAAFLPALIFMCPCQALRQYAKAGAQICATFLIGPACKGIIYYIYFYPKMNYYLYHDSHKFKEAYHFNDLHDYLENILPNLNNIINHTGFMIVFCIFLSILSWAILKKNNKITHISAALSTIYVLFPVFMYWPLCGFRYFIYSALFSLAGILAFIREYKINARAFALISLILTVILFVTPYFNFTGRNLHVYDDLRSLFERGARDAIMANHGLLPYLAEDRPISLSLPEYKVFQNHANNQLIDYIVFYPHLAKDWPANGQTITDKAGNVFKLLKVFPEIANLHVYKRM